MIGLGIDAGGTFTDGVLFDMVGRSVLAKAKSHTTRQDLTIGIGKVMSVLCGSGQWDPGTIGLVSLSTTLATNAIVEGKGGSAGLILIGYDKRILDRYFTVGSYELVDGCHDIDGEERIPLDEDALRRTAEGMKGRIDALAVSAYMAARNPDHEVRAKEILGGILDVPIICGHELSGELDSLKRATTTVLNARLIPVIIDLIASVRKMMDENGVDAPLMIVKGDGSLMGEAMAMLRPVETILSGPAASIAGASFLAGTGDGVVLDMGGTTSDIGIIRGGRTKVNPGGASVGGYRTCVRAVDVVTTGLGGDSYLQVDGNRKPVIGPRRVVPLSWLAAEYPAVGAEVSRLDSLAIDGRLSGLVQPCDFLVLVKRPGNGGTLGGRELHAQEEAILNALEAGPLSRYQLCSAIGYPYPSLLRTEGLEEHGMVLRAGPTPTDCLHVLGMLSLWDAGAATTAAGIMGRLLDTDAPGFALMVKRACEAKLAKETALCLLGDSMGRIPESTPALEHVLGMITAAPDPDGGKGAGVYGVRIDMRVPLVGIGAPIASYLPGAAERLGCGLVIPEHCDVANAVGAVTGRIVVQAEVVVRLNTEGLYVAHSQGGRSAFESLAEAMDWATVEARREAVEAAMAAGAEGVGVSMEYRDSMGRPATACALLNREGMFVECGVRAVATGAH